MEQYKIHQLYIFRLLYIPSWYSNTQVYSSNFEWIRIHVQEMIFFQTFNRLRNEKYYFFCFKHSQTKTVAFFCSSHKSFAMAYSLTLIGFVLSLMASALIGFIQELIVQFFQLRAWVLNTCPYSLQGLPLHLRAYL